MYHLSRNYCRWFCCAIVAMSSTVAALNWIVDPYEVYVHSTSSYFRRHKARLGQRISNAEIARRGTNDVLLLGDSRVGFGLDPGHPALVSRGKTANLALSAGSIYEGSRMIKMAFDHAPPKVVVWGIPPEFVMLDRNPKFEFDFDASLLNPQLSSGEYHGRNLLSLNATKDSFVAMYGKFISQPKSSPKIATETWALQSKSGIDISHKAFTEPLPSPKDLAAHEPLPSIPETEELLRNCFIRCRQHGVQLKILIPPVHAVYLERLQVLGMRDRLEAGKRVLVRLATETNLIVSDAPPVEIWDFSDFSGPPSEECPTATTPVQMRWYMDAIHFSHALGDVVLNRMFGVSDDFPKFGTQLTTANIEDHLARLRDARIAYLRRQPGQVKIAVEGLATRH